MTESGSSPGRSDQALARTASGRARDRQAVEERRALVAQMRVQDLSVYAIRDALEREHQIVVSISTVVRDVALFKAALRKRLGARGFDALGELAAIVARYESTIRRCTQRSDKATDDRAFALLAKVALDAQKQLSDLLQDVGLLDDRVSRLISDDAAKDATRIPSGEELQKRFAELVVKEGERISPAEIAWAHGDAAAAAQAAQDSRDDTTH